MDKHTSKTNAGSSGAKFHYGAKKSLGQNFLNSKGAVADIIRTAEIKHGETVLEIGPGKGILTQALLSAGAQVVAVEKDIALFDFLKEKFAEELKSGQLKLICGDILALSPHDYQLQTTNYKLVSNIPYSITGEILRKFIGGNAKPSCAVLLVQKEVAERIVERGGKGSILSASVSVYGKPKYIKKVPARYFNPKPKVDSAILLVENIKNSFKNENEEKRFFEILKRGFAHKRKKLSGNLSEVFEKEKLAEIFVSCGIRTDARAENLKLSDWLCLSRS